MPENHTLNFRIHLEVFHECQWNGIKKLCLYEDLLRKKYFHAMSKAITHEMSVNSVNHRTFSNFQLPKT